MTTATRLPAEGSLVGEVLVTTDASVPAAPLGPAVAPKSSRRPSRSIWWAGSLGGALLLGMLAAGAGGLGLLAYWSPEQTASPVVPRRGVVVGAADDASAEVRAPGPGVAEAPAPDPGVAEAPGTTEDPAPIVAPAPSPATIAQPGPAPSPQRAKSRPESTAASDVSGEAEPTPAPAPSTTAAPSPTVALEPAASAVAYVVSAYDKPMELRGDDGKTYPVGEVPPQRYAIWAEFKGELYNSGQITVAPNERVRITCNPVFFECGVN